jgi:MSHA biogenesis protein MshN
MSLINQVLNDLEKRGAHSNLGEATIRAVPVQRKVRTWLWFAAAVGVIVGLGGAAWWALRQSPALPPSVNSGTPVLAGMTAAASPVVAASQVQAPLPQAGAQLSSAESSVSSASGVAPRANLELSWIPLLESLYDKSRAESAVPAAADSPQVQAANKANADARLEPVASISKVEKKVSPQQLAENEYRKANLLAQQGKFQEAIAGYEAALKLDPVHDGMAREALVTVLLQSKRNADAEKVLHEGLAQDVKQTRFAMLLARLQVERGAQGQALDTLGRTLPYADQQADYQAFMAALLQRQNRHKEAITHYQIALQLSPGSGLWLMGLGISLQAVQRKEDALDAYQRATEARNLSPELQAFVAQRIKEIK